MNTFISGRYIKTFCLIIACLVFSQSLVFATPLSEKRARLSEIKEQIDSLDTKIEIADEEYLQAANKLDVIEEKVEENQFKLNKARIKLRKSKRLLNNRARGIYQSGQLTIIEIIFNTRSFEEFLESWDFLVRVGLRDAQIVRQVKKCEAEFTKAQKQLNASRNEQKKTVDTLYAKKKEIEGQIAAKEELMQGIEADIERLEREQRAAEIRQMRQNSVPIDTGGKPTNAPKGGVVAVAYAQLGKPYRWGAAGPDAFDCSGLTMYCYAQVGVSLPHSSGAQYNSGQHVGREYLQPGDLVFFGSPIHHVGLYIGSGAMIHSPHSGDVVKIAPAFRGDYVGATRP